MGIRKALKAEPCCSSARSKEDISHFFGLCVASGSICGVVACLALAVRYSKSAIVPSSWLVTWVVYSIVTFAVILLRIYMKSYYVDLKITILLPYINVENPKNIHGDIGFFDPEVAKPSSWNEVRDMGSSCLILTSLQREFIENRLIPALVVSACYNSLFHVIVMAVLILRRIKGPNQDDQTGKVCE